EGLHPSVALLTASINVVSSAISSISVFGYQYRLPCRLPLPFTVSVISVISITAFPIPSFIHSSQVTSKLHPRHLGYETTLRQFNASLRDLHTSYVDLFLLHYAECWGNLCEGAVPKGNFFDSWRALEELYEAGLVRAIVLQAIGQEVVAAAAAAVAAAAAAGNGNGSGGGGGSRSAAQVALRWALQQGLVVLPRSSNQGRIRENLQLYDWGLSAAHIRQIAHLKPAT
ncbi:hypothetical protein Vafri_20666, partial [Volvox africanus]